MSKRMGDPIDMRSLIKALLIVTATVAVVSAPVIPERCIACNRRECPVGIAKPLRMLSPVEWLYDTTDDLHCNFGCAMFFNWINNNG